MSEPPEDALRSEDKEANHCSEDDWVCPNGRDDEACKRLHLREQQARNDSAPDRAHATDDYDRESKQDEVASHGGENGIDWREQYAR
jgi:hypothetical protein